MTIRLFYLLLFFLLHASAVQAAAGEMKAAFDSLNQSRSEVLISSSSSATGGVEDDWFLALKKLRLDAIAKTDTETVRKIEAIILAAGRNGVKSPHPSDAGLPAPASSDPSGKNSATPVEEFKADLDKLNQSHSESLTGATSSTTGDVEDEWYVALKKLRLDAIAKSDTGTVKKIEAILLAAGRNGVSLPVGSTRGQSASLATSGAVGAIPSVGSIWQGTIKTRFSDGFKGETETIEAIVTSVTDSTFLLRTSNQNNGQIWDWTFKVEKQDLEVIQFVRVRAAQTVKNPLPPRDVTGKGRLENDRMTFQFSWPQPDKGLIYRGTFELTPEK